MGSDRARARRPQLMAGYFNPRSPDGERPRPGRTRPGRIPYFNPRSPDGERPTIPITATALYTFQSTLPGWGATYPIYDETHRSDLFQSTLPGWGATNAMRAADAVGYISIHAPRMGSDVLTNFRVSAHAHFNPRSPDGERHGAAGLAHPRTDFNPRSPDGERQTPPKPTTRPPHFNPRSPDGERPDAPMRAASYPPYFNPRSPDGERRWEVSGYPSRDAFQSTLPGWGATTRNHRKRQRQDNFNPRSPDGERRFAPSAPRPIGSDFNPRSPDGERPVTVPPWPIVPIFQSTLPGWGATLKRSDDMTQKILFQSTLPGWGATLRFATAPPL